MCVCVRQGLMYMVLIFTTLQASELWEHAEVGDVLPYRPLDPLFSQARASMLYAPSTFPLPHPTTCPEVVFGQVENYTHEESTVACSQEAYSFYAGARQMTNLKYLAAMGVSTPTQLSPRSLV